MKLAYFIPFLLMFSFTGYEQKQEVKISFIFSTEGYGYSIPASTKIIVYRHIVIWYYENGTTKSFVPEFEVKGKQFGIGIIFFGLWKAPSILKQPGNITAMGFGIVFIFYNFSSSKPFLNFFNENGSWTIQNSISSFAFIDETLLKQ